MGYRLIFRTDEEISFNSVNRLNDFKFTFYFNECNVKNVYVTYFCIYIYYYQKAESGNMLSMHVHKIDLYEYKNLKSHIFVPKYVCNTL